MHVCIYVHMYVYMYVRICMYVHMYVSMYVLMYVCMYVCVHSYAYTCSLGKFMGTSAFSFSSFCKISSTLDSLNSPSLLLPLDTPGIPSLSGRVPQSLVCVLAGWREVLCRGTLLLRGLLNRHFTCCPWQQGIPLLPTPLHLQGFLLVVGGASCQGYGRLPTGGGGVGGYEVRGCGFGEGCGFLWLGSACCVVSGLHPTQLEIGTRILWLVKSFNIFYSLSNPATLGTGQSVLIRGVASFQG